MEWKRCTRVKDGSAVVINLATVAALVPHEDHTVVLFVGGEFGRMTVSESVRDILTEDPIA